LALGLLRVDLNQGIVDTSDGPSGLTPRAEELLLLLCRFPNKLVTREQIHETIWAGRVVEEATITNIVWLIRKAIGEDGKDVLQTRAKRGYVLVVPQSAWLVEPAEVSIQPDIDVEIEGEPSQSAQTLTNPDSAQEDSEVSVSSRSLGMRLAVLGFVFIAISVAVATYSPSPTIGKRTETDPDEFAPRASAVPRLAQMRLNPEVEMTVSVSVPDNFDWVRNEVLRVAVEQAYLRDSGVVYFEKAHSRNPFAGPHLQVIVSHVDNDSLDAELTLNQGAVALRETYRGTPHRLGSAVSKLLIGGLQPATRTTNPAIDAFVSAMTASLRYDYQKALPEYRRALGRDPKMADAAINLAFDLYTLGRSREAYTIMVGLESNAGLNPKQSCDRMTLLAEIAPNEFDTTICESADTLAKQNRRETRDALRSVNSAGDETVSARHWYDDQEIALNAHLDLDEIAQGEARISSAKLLAEEAGWEHASIEIGGYAAAYAHQQGHTDRARAIYETTADRMAGTGDLEQAINYKIKALRIASNAPGPKIDKQRKSLQQIIEQARIVGSVKHEIAAQQSLMRYERDNLRQWQRHLNRILKLSRETQMPRNNANVVHRAIGELLALRRYRGVLQAVAPFEGKREVYAHSQLWTLSLKTEALLWTDQLGSAVSVVDEMEGEKFDISGSRPCVLAWLMSEAGREDRARSILRKCPYKTYDRDGKSLSGDFGLLAEARLDRFGDHPAYAWLKLKPRIDELLATPELTLDEAVSLTLLARHATAMPGADPARLRRALTIASELATKDGAGPGLRFGVHLLRWRLCVADRRSDCGPILPSWAQEDRLEARLATEYQQSLEAGSRK
jgi:DNA-binding winged helix-turn-helix (wHTH) protein/tetratricopeptide (TPR) repeat protein